jgi:hypothetical protein
MGRLGGKDVIEKIISIKRSLELCSMGCDGNGCDYVPGCDGLSCERCIDNLAADALSLIEDQEKEIKKLERMLGDRHEQD